MLDQVFTRGTTPTHVFPISQNLTKSDIIDFTITYRQKNNNILIKYAQDDCEIQEVDNKKNIVLVLSQSDTLLFNPNIKKVEVQVKIKTKDNKVFIDNYRMRLEDCFDNEEI